MSQPAFLIRHMTLEDLDQVYDIDQMSFSLPWPKRSFHYEVADNRNSVCWVVEALLEENRPAIVGMAIVWLVVDEAHIATIAIHPQYRGLGIGKRLLVALLDHARQLGMLRSTLEVRANNKVAQALYKDFGFEVVGVRPRYYQDNQEDALILTLEFARTPEKNKFDQEKFTPMPREPVSTVEPVCRTGNSNRGVT